MEASYVYSIPTTAKSAPKGDPTTMDFDCIVFMPSR
jgi:hypothetical protein